MNALAVLVAFVIFILLLQTGDFPLVFFAILLVLGVADEKRLAAIARNIGKIYYRIKVETANLMGIEREVLDNMNVLDMLNKSLGNVAEWRASRLTKSSKSSSELIELYKLMKGKGS
ncbi:hypothetical protein IPA_00605 [Ignicoccus pacificus DSM 13166]|uniref:Uncharacterized protein n=1 Tax=Ignicoccus pacificus DSM 13166 TaxID=940294 RepID=A0A977PL06_9CREN|nr:hypothetical protein IPA_00605 [Ignicoccus pacificus DSM 13166]